MEWALEIGEPTLPRDKQPPFLWMACRASRHSSPGQPPMPVVMTDSRKGFLW